MDKKQSSSTPPLAPPVPVTVGQVDVGGNHPNNMQTDVTGDNQSAKMLQKILRFRLIGNIERQDTGELKSLIKAGVSVNSTIVYGKTPLLYALELGFTDVALVLLRAGANPTLPENVSCRRFPLHFAAWNNLLEPAELILRGGTFCDCLDSGEMTPLHYAAYKGFKEMVNLLLSFGAVVDAKDNVGRTPLNRAIEENHIDIFRILISVGADVNTQDKFGWTSLYHGIMWNDPDLVELLLDSGASVKMTNSRGETPLHVACARIRYVNGVVVNATSFDIIRRTRRIPTEQFKYVIQTRTKTSFRIVKNLINAKADVEAGNALTERPLHVTDNWIFLVYLVLAGSWVNKDMIMYDDLTLSDPRSVLHGWLVQQYNDQICLQRQCRRALRQHVTHLGRETISEALGYLPLPEKLRNYLNICDFDLEILKLEHHIMLD